MKIAPSSSLAGRDATRGSILVIVLWITFGLVAITLYFANEMSLELHASDNRVSGLTAEQAIEGAARYAGYILTNQIAYGTNGNIPDPTTYQSEAVPIGDAHFWFIGRDNTGQAQPDQVTFGLIDEASKLNLNTVAATNLSWLPNMTAEIAANIVDWRNTNGTTSPDGDGSTAYSSLSYLAKNEPFETVDELRLVYGMDMSLLVGEDGNRNGALDPNETDANGNSIVHPGIADYLTVYSREPNPTNNLSGHTKAQLATMLERNFGFARGRANQIAYSFPGATNATVNIASLLQFYLRCQRPPANLTLSEFSQIATNASVTNGTYLKGRVNVNTASAAVLACLLEGDTASAQALVSYRLANPGSLTSIAWVADALSGSPTALQTLAAHDFLTTQSFQFTADIAALGPNGRGYRRAKFVFDTVDGTPKIIYRQDLTGLGWALGKDARQTWLFAKDTP
jgi:type II secretory pathway component PulK